LYGSTNDAKDSTKDANDAKAMNSVKNKANNHILVFCSYARAYM
jgi:hypothetical protein